VERGLKLAQDPDARVRFQAALELGAWPAATLREEPWLADETARRVAEALAAIGRRGGADRWTQTAVLAGTRGRERDVAEALKRDLVRGAETAPGFVVEFARVTATALEPRETAALAADLLTQPLPRWEQQFLWLNGLARAIRRRPDLNTEQGVLAGLLALISGDHAVVLESLRQSAAELSDNHDLPAEQRLVAVELLGACDGGRVGPTLLALVDTREPAEVQRGAVKALTELRRPEWARALLEAGLLTGVSPGVRDEILSGVLTDTRTTTVLLEELEQERLPKIVVDAYRRRMLTQHADPGVKARAEALFGAVTGDRAKVYAEYRDVVELASNATRGREVFRRVCANCHRLEREGYQVGPDLFSIRNQPKSAILLHILVPDQEITEGFTAQTVLTRDGRTLSGLVASETATSLTLRMQQGKEESLSKDEIEELAPSTTSLMPQGLEKDLSRQDLADLLAFLKGERGE
jgi:putative heme-binding domain-containing protein